MIVYKRIKSFFKRIIPRIIWNQLYKIKSFIISRFEIPKTCRLTELLDTFPRKEKIEIVFIIYMPEVFSSFQSIYEAAMADEKFSVHILAQPHVDNQQGLQGQNPAYNYLRNLYPNVINAYENGKWFDLQSLNPDYVFYTRPYNYQYYSSYWPKEVRHYAKVCFHQYSYDMDKSADFFIVYNYSFMQNVALCFNSAKSIGNKVSKRIVSKRRQYPQVHCLGFTRFDLLQKELIANIDTSEKKTILWLPRWAAVKKQGKRQGHFFYYIENFLNFAERNKNVNFIIRPHPLMFANFIALGLYKQEDIDLLYNRCAKLGNVCIDTDKSYFPSLKQADILFSDYTALLVEFFVTGKPIIYCDDASTFNPEMKRMDKCFYHLNKWDDIEEQLSKLLKEEDILKEERLKEISYFINGTNAGKNIINCIKKDYFKDFNCNEQ